MDYAIMLKTPQIYYGRNGSTVMTLEYSWDQLLKSRHFVFSANNFVYQSTGYNSLLRVYRFFSSQEYQAGKPPEGILQHYKSSCVVTAPQ